MPHRTATRGVVVLITCVTVSGCMAMRLSGRGAPDEAIRELTIDLGPVDLPALTMGHEGEQRLDPTWVSVRESGWVHAFDHSLTDETGEEVPREVLHHFNEVLGAPGRFDAQRLLGVDSASEYSTFGSHAVAERILV